MNRFLATLPVLLLLATVPAFADDATPAAPEATQVLVSVDKLAHDPGEEIVFTIAALDKDRKPATGAVVWSLDADDGRPTKKGSGTTATPEAPVTVRTTMDKPGFLRLTARLDSPGAKTFAAGAAVSPDTLAAVPEPEDFDAFWAAQKAIVDSADISKAVLADAPESVSSQDRYKGMRVCTLTFPFAEGMVPATAWIVMPKGAAPKSVRTIKAGFEGYGFGGKQAPQWFDRNAINIQINAHGFELGRDKDYYAEFEKATKSNGQGYGLDPQQNASAETSYFRGMVLRDLAALRFAMTLPEWSGASLEVSGGSQGGFQSAAMAALLPAVTHCTLNAPWLCDLGGSAKLGRMRSTFQPGYTDAMRYFDTANFGKRITCPVVIQRSGLADYCCPPSGVTVLYNNLTRAKSRSIHYIQGSEHLTPTDWNPPQNDWRQTFDLP